MLPNPNGGGTVSRAAERHSLETGLPLPIRTSMIRRFSRDRSPRRSAPLTQTLDIRRCRTARDWRLFERIPELLHGDDPAFVPPIPGEVAKLRGRGHIFHLSGTLRAYVAFRARTPVGRVASIVNRTHNEFHGDTTGFFGFFSFADEDVAGPLLEQVRQDLAEQGRDLIRGPFNPTQNDECGLQVEGFGKRPYFGMPYNPPWYVDVYESLGLEKARDLVAYDVDPSLEKSFDHRLRGLAERVRERLGITVRPIDMKRQHEEAQLITRLFNECLAEEWNFMPLSVEMAEAFAKDLAGQLDPEAILIAEANGEPAGLSIALPDLNVLLTELKRFPRWLRLIRLLWLLKTRRCQAARWAVFGMLPQYRRKGGTLVLIYEAITRGKRRYSRGESSWTQDTNSDIARLVAELGVVPYKRYRIYETRV